MSAEVKQHIEGDPTRNAGIRMRTARVLDGVATVIDQRLPFVTPNGLTIFGGICVTAGLALQERQNRRGHATKKETALALLLQAVGHTSDWLDGPLARRKAQTHPGQHDATRGELVDIGTDRVEEVAAALMRARTARLKGRRLGEKAALAVAITTALPSLARAITESRGNAIAEHGNNPIEMVGTRAGRVVAMTVGAQIERSQTIVDLVGTVANLNTTRERLRGSTSSQIPVLTESQREGAKRRAALLVPLIVASAGAVVYSMGQKRRS